MAKTGSKTEKPKQVGRPEKAPATAPGQALGYSLQFTRLTAMLMEAPNGSACSLEVLDDIAQQDNDGNTVLSQSKSALTGNPVADRAVSLWKTLFNWLTLAERKIVIPAQTIFEIYVSRQVEGDLINAFDKACTIEEARAAVTKARDALWGPSPEHDRRAALPESISYYANPVLEASEDLLFSIIINLRLVCGGGSPQEDIETAIRRGPVSEARVFDIADKMCGWVKRQVDKRLEKNLPAFILRDDFHHEYVSYVRSTDRDIILKSFAGKPSEREKLECLPETFVQQLDLIELSFDDKLQAISDFLRACSDRAIWSRAGDVHEDSFTELDESLHRTWTNLDAATCIEAASKSDIERGRLLLARCMLHQAKVQGMEPPAHFVPGCFHRLADDTAIGWHPSFRGLLKKITVIKS